MLTADATIALRLDQAVTEISQERSTNSMNDLPESGRRSPRLNQSAGSPNSRSQPAVEAEQ
jgi:hypothetical protein